LSIVPKVIVLTILLFICYSAAGAVLGPQGDAQTAAPGALAVALLTVCFLDTVVLTPIILHSRWSGWRLMATVFFVFYGVTTFMSQIESAVFITNLPPGLLPRLFLMGALVAAPFSVLAVVILGKTKAETVDTDANGRLVMPASEWTWKLAALALAYLTLYFVFGYFIAWRNPAVRDYYGGVDEGSFFTHMSTVVGKTFWLMPLQIVRGLLWVAIAVPVIHMMKGSWQQIAVMIGLLFAVVMNAQLLLPNPYMPEAVRVAHLIETASSNFIFGLLVGCLLRKSR
jgi:hypothetical protein